MTERGVPGTIAVARQTEGNPLEHAEAPTDGQTYMPALDGLRALAVAAVVAYHLDATWARGGFIGVDLFFVLSGFLITGLLLRESDSTGTVALLRFWRRRLQRLAPALLFMIASTAVAARLLLDSDRWVRVRTDSFSAALYFSNWSAISEKLGYFDTLLPPSPLRHTWSLSIEEQFYIVWPLLIALCCLVRKRRVLMVAIVAGVLATASVISMVLHDGSSLRAYYGTDSRAHELLIGALLAIVVGTTRGTRFATFASRWLLAPALVSFGVGVFVLSDASASLFRGALTASAVVGGIAVIGATSTAPTGVARLLTHEPLGWIGRRSYAIYLWHWPVVVIIEGSRRINGRPSQVVAAIALTLLLAEVTHRLIETPYRRMLPSPRLAFATLATVAATACVVIVALASARQPSQVHILRPQIAAAGVGPASTSASRSSLSALAPTDRSIPPSSTAPAPAPAAQPGRSAAPSGLATSATDAGPVDSSAVTGSVQDGSVGDATTAPPEPANAPASTTASSATTVAAPVPSVLLFGDSTALRLALDVGDQHLLDAVHLQPYASLGCSLAGGQLLDEGSKRPIVQPPYCAGWQSGWQGTVSSVARPSAVVIMVGAWEVYDRQISGKRVSFGTQEWTQLVTSSLQQDVAVAASTGAPVFLLRLPCMAPDPKAAISSKVRTDPARIAAFNDVLEQVAAQQPGVRTLPLDQVLCPNGHPAPDQDGTPIRYDGVHTSPVGSAVVWTWLQDQLRADGAFAAQR